MLIEAMVAVLILSVSLLGLAYLQAQGSKLNTSSYTHTQATLLAAELMEQARLHGTTGLDVNAATLCDVTSVDPAVEKRCWLDAVASTLPSGTAVINIVGNAVQISITWLERNLREDPGLNSTPPRGNGYTANRRLVWNLEL